MTRITDKHLCDVVGNGKFGTPEYGALAEQQMKQIDRTNR